ncbi:hypothetical protein [Bacteroides cellulosilyticus]|nr:hypothetical protein [Bacteroides cellulosilyticus]
MQLKPCITTPGKRFTAPLPRLFRETTQTNRNQDRHFLPTAHPDRNL